ncbi:hypothetical protein HDV05_008368 [Chytridiales sp. JEL 0842]|nr:hypothetical protein HDV05_008368 [Chytridiales sp. JEL 0842]
MGGVSSPFYNPEDTIPADYHSHPFFTKSTSFNNNNNNNSRDDDNGSDAGSVHTTVTSITTSTQKGKPHRMQWRSPSRQQKNLSSSDSFSTPALERDEDEDDNGDDRRAPSPSPAGKSNAFSKAMTLSSSPTSMEPNTYAPRMLWPQGTRSSIKSESDNTTTTFLEAYVRPAAADIAREGILYHPTLSSYTKSHAIATYHPSTTHPILHLYHLPEDIHPFKLIHLHSCTGISNPHLKDGLYEFKLTMDNGAHVPLAAETTEDASNWILALKMMMSGGGSTDSQGSFSRTASEEFEPVAEDVQTQDQLNQLRAEIEALRAENELLKQQQSSSSQPLPTENLETLLDSKTTQIIEAIWASHTTTVNTSTTSLTPTFTELREQLEGLTESMETRTSRIGRMVHEVLKRTEVGGDGGIWKEVKEGIEEVVGKVIQQETQQLKVESGNGGAVKGEEVVKGVEVLVEGLKEGMKGVEGDMGSLLSLLAEAQIAQRAGFAEVTELTAENHKEVVKLQVKTKDELQSSIVERLGHLQENLKASLQSLVLEQLTTPAHSRSTSGTEKELVNAKLDNILEVIDFVNQSQCRLVTLITEKMLKAPNSPIRTPNSTTTTVPIDDLKLRETLKSTLQDICRDPTGPFQPLLLPTSASHFSLNMELPRSSPSSSTEGPQTLQSALQDIEKTLSRSTTDTRSSFTHLESWMARVLDLIKMVRRDVGELERVERERTVEGVFGEGVLEKLGGRIEQAVVGCLETAWEKKEGGYEGVVKGLEEVGRLGRGMKDVLEGLKESVNASNGAVSELIKSGNVEVLETLKALVPNVVSKTLEAQVPQQPPGVSFESIQAVIDSSEALKGLKASLESLPSADLIQGGTVEVLKALNDFQEIVRDTIGKALQSQAPQQPQTISVEDIQSAIEGSGTLKNLKASVDTLRNDSTVADLIKTQNADVLNALSHLQGLVPEAISKALDSRTPQQPLTVPAESIQAAIEGSEALRTLKTSMESLRNDSAVADMIESKNADVLSALNGLQALVPDAISKALEAQTSQTNPVDSIHAALESSEALKSLKATLESFGNEKTSIMNEITAVSQSQATLHAEVKVFLESSAGSQQTVMQSIETQLGGFNIGKQQVMDTLAEHLKARTELDVDIKQAFINSHSALEVKISETMKAHMESMQREREMFMAELKELFALRGGLKEEVGQLEAQKEVLKKDLETLEKEKGRLEVVQPVRAAVESLEKELEERIAMLIREVEELSCQKELLIREVPIL